PPPSLIVRIRAACAAWAVISRPVWKCTPWRRWNVQVRPSADFDQLVASSGSTLWVTALYRVSVSYMVFIAMMPSEYSVAGSQPSPVAGGVVWWVNPGLAAGGGAEELGPPQAARSRASADPDASSSPPRWGFMDASVVFVGDWAVGAVGQG